MLQDNQFDRAGFVRALAGIGCVSAALLMIELALTRIFSVTMYYHFAFLAISIALFGLSASGVYVYVWRGSGSTRARPPVSLPFTPWCLRSPRSCRWPRSCASASD